MFYFSFFISRNWNFKLKSSYMIRSIFFVFTHKKEEINSSRFFDLWSFLILFDISTICNMLFFKHKYWLTHFYLSTWCKKIFELRYDLLSFSYILHCNNFDFKKSFFVHFSSCFYSLGINFSHQKISNIENKNCFWNFLWNCTQFSCHQIGVCMVHWILSNNLTQDI